MTANMAPYNAQSRQAVITSPIGGISLPESACAALELILKAVEVQRIILFGSRAVGDHDERSDFDIAISAPDLNRAGVSRMRDAVGQSRTLYKISISRLEFMPHRLKACVLLQGVTIYERKKTEGQLEQFGQSDCKS